MGILHISDKDFHPIESLSYKGTKQWIKIVKELGSKYPPDTNIHDERQDEAGTVTVGALAGALVAVQIYETEKERK